MWEKQEQEFTLRTYLYRRPQLTTGTGGRGGNRR
jgi:hypothetical protein